MTVKQIRKYCQAKEDVKDLLKTAINQLNLSTRAYDQILKLSRTIADHEGVENITLIISKVNIRITDCYSKNHSQGIREKYQLVI